MKKVFLFLLSVLAVSLSYGAVNAPKDTKGESLDTIDWIGALPCNIDASTGTQPALCGAINITKRKYVVYGVMYSGIPVSNYLVFRDTNTANTTSSTAAVVFASSSTQFAGGTSTTGFFKFPVPLRFTNGVSVNVNVAPASGLERWTIFYRPVDTDIAGD